MTSAAARQDLGARAAGRALGVSHSYLVKLAKAGRLPRNGDGTFDVEECRRILRTITDPGQVRTANPDRWSSGNRPVEAVTSDQSSPQPPPGETSSLWETAIEAAEHATDPFEKGITAAVVMLAHRVGAVMACLAAYEGAPLAVAFGLRDAATVGFIGMGEDLLRELPCFAHQPADAELPILYRPELFDRVDWDVVARGRGELADVEAWAAETHQRRERAAA